MTPNQDIFYITTPIYYVNAKPHLGHAYTTVVADVCHRFHKMKNKTAFFLTGTDEHGDKVVKAAQNENMSTKGYVDFISGLFQNLWPDLSVDFSQFIRTTDVNHIETVKQILQKIYDSGDIYFSEYEGLYCFGCEQFYTEKELVDGLCPDHGTAPEIIKESNYFFKMSAYQDWLIDHIKTHPTFIRPERYRNEVLSFLKDPLEDLCISRPKTRLTWGISLPFDDRYVTYVWFDALINYISALGYPDDQRFSTFWPHAQHVVAKDILKPHGIYWPTMLKAAGIPVYQHLNVHGYWNVDNSKMSKSVGNVVDPLKLKDVYGIEAFRYFLMREMSFGLDADFNESALVQRINSDLANDLGNLVSRTLTMVHKYFKGLIPDISVSDIKDDKIKEAASDAVRAVDSFMNDFAFNKALASIWELISHMNRYIDSSAPWELAKKEENRDELSFVIYNLLEGLRIIAGLIYPVMPDTSQKILALLKQDMLATGMFTWGQLNAGIRIEKSVTLFPRIDTKAKKEKQKSQKIDRKLTDLKPEIDYEDFQKIDLRVGTVLDAEHIPESKKLLKLQVDIGEKRTIVAGISKHYSPEDIIGKQVIVAANLKPATLMGITSEGMVLAAVKKKKCSVLIPDQSLLVGTPVQ
ncbi:MAG: methionine--tRNA ligase [Candidatus Magnetomorum sp.]|nr:methionine--tRNA ligase [Candidatus Magnetomorum sp.]